MAELQHPDIVVMTLIVCVTILEAIALHEGIDGQLFSTAIAGLAGFIAYLLPSPLQKK